MTNQLLPLLDPKKFADTRDALHAYARILGHWTSTCRARRKHWWHASLRPSLNGVTTGVIYADGTQFEIELSLRESVIMVFTAIGEPLRLDLHGQPASEPADLISEFLMAAGVSNEIARKVDSANLNLADGIYAAYSAEQADKMATVLSLVSASMVSFRAGVREETSPIQLWPHHFDLAMLWLPGDKVPDQDPENEEYADKQMNFGFTFGDDGIPEPYFYVTAYPLPDAFSSIDFADGTTWRTDGFTGAVLTYRRLLEERDPHATLLQLWNSLRDHGTQHLMNQTGEE